MKWSAARDLGHNGEGKGRSEGLRVMRGCFWREPEGSRDGGENIGVPSSITTHAQGCTVMFDLLYMRKKRLKLNREL